MKSYLFLSFLAAIWSGMPHSANAACTATTIGAKCTETSECCRGYCIPEGVAPSGTLGNEKFRNAGTCGTDNGSRCRLPGGSCFNSDSECCDGYKCVGEIVLGILTQGKCTAP